MSVEFATQPKIKKRFKTVAGFENWLSEQSHLTDKRFEFVYGEIIEKPAMKQEEVFIFTFLQDLFFETLAFKKRAGRLITELGAYIDKHRKRIPDIAYFTEKQFLAMGEGKKLSPPFAIEILSPNERFKDIEDKIADYFDAGIKLVWYISPTKEQIYAYTSPKDIKIYGGEDVCNAAPILPDLSFKTKEMFIKKTSK